MQKRLFIQYKQVFTILHLKIPSVRLKVARFEGDARPCITHKHF